MVTSLQSPGVEVREIDLSTIVPSVSTTEGVLAGVSRWGPVDQRVLVDSENNLVRRFGAPTNFNFETWFTGANFLAYGNKLYFTRVANTAGVTPTVSANTDTGSTTITLASGNTQLLEPGMILINSSGGGVSNGATIAAITNSTAFTVSTLSDVLANTTTDELQFVSNTAFSAVSNTNTVANLEYHTIANDSVFTARDGTFDTDVNWIARYPGELGNSLRVSVCANSLGYTSTINAASYGANTYMQVNNNSNTANVTVLALANADGSANATSFKNQVNLTDLIEVGNTSIGTQKLKVTAVGNTSTFGTSNVNMDITTVVGNTSITADDTTGLVAGMELNSGNTSLHGLRVASVTNSTVFVVESAPTVAVSTDAAVFYPRAEFQIQFEDRYSLAQNYLFSAANSSTRSISRHWEFFDFIDKAPGNSDHQIAFGNNSVNSDEMHVVVTDNDGKFTGIPGEVLETYRGLSRATDNKTVEGAANFWKDVINERSEYVYIANDLSGAISNTAENLTSSTLDVLVSDLQYGRDGKDESNIEIAEVTGGYDLYSSVEDVDVSLIMQGKARSATLANYLIDNIALKREPKDTVVFISPQRGDVVGNPNNEQDACVTFRNTVRNSSYGFMDSGYKYMYDRYNDVNRWVPLNGDIAGLAVRTDRTNAPWWSFAGLNRGQIKNVIKLAWNPRQAQRDVLYKNNINPVMTRPGEGTVLFGDKTLLSKSSAFDRVNVRRLFIVLEKAIAKASKYSLFEFNDDFTRLQFKNMVVPYLRDVQGQRGIQEFYVVCDGTNNTPEVIDRNEFVADIYIKPARSINFIRLNFVAVRTGVAFSEVVGRF